MVWARIGCLDVSDNSVIVWFLASILLKIWILNDLRCFVAFWFCREIYGKKIWIRISQIQYGGGGLHFGKVFPKIPVFFKRWLPLVSLVPKAIAILRLCLQGQSIVWLRVEPTPSRDHFCVLNKWKPTSSCTCIQIQIQAQTQIRS